MGPQAKKRKLTPAVEEITFDPTAREEFLTGFHKRKLQRAKHAQEMAEKIAREERLEQRRKIREERKAEFQRIMEENERCMRELKGDSDSQSGDESDADQEEWDGFAEPPAVDYEAEYIDEDKYTTVTVEEMDPSKEGLYQAEREEADAEGGSPDGDAGQTAANSSSATKKAKRVGNADKPKKKKKFRYESKEERKVARVKQKLGNRKKAQARREG